MEIGQAIKQARKNRGMKQCELAKNTGLTPAAISQIEKGSRNPNLKSVQSLLRVLGLTFEQLCDVTKDEYCLLCKQKIPEEEWK